MTAFLIVLAVAAEAYLLGSVDTGILVSKYLYHDDVRTHGSGAAGMTNMLRTFGKKAAAMTAAVDVLSSMPYAEAVAARAGLPLKMTCCAARLCDALRGSIPNLFPMEIQKLYYQLR